MVEAVHQRLAEEGIVEVADLFVGDAGAGVVDLENQAIRVLGLMVDNQRNLAAGGGDNGVMHQQRDHFAKRVGVADIVLLDVQLEMFEQRQPLLIEGRQGLQQQLVDHCRWVERFARRLPVPVSSRVSRVMLSIKPSTEADSAVNWPSSACCCCSSGRSRRRSTRSCIWRTG